MNKQWNELEESTEGLKLEMTVEDQLTEPIKRMKLANDDDESPVILKREAKIEKKRNELE